MNPCKNIGMKQFRGGGLICLLMLALIAPAFSLAASNTVIPEKTQITIQLNKKLSTKVNSEGDTFTAVVTTAIFLGERMVIPKGSEVTGSISRILRPGRFKGRAVMNVLFQSIKIPGHGELPIVATLVGVDADVSGGVRSEGTVEGEGSEASDIGKIVVPSLAGAGIGTLAGGGKGAAIGTGVGAAIGLASVFATRGKDIEIPRGSTMSISLDNALVIPADEESDAAKNR
jgi:hypothetical protein